MTVNELYRSALALLNTDEMRVKSYPRQKIPFVNLLLAKYFSLENWIREGKNEEKLDTVPEADGPAYEIPYDEKFVRECLPYALAAMFAADDDRDIANVYSAMFERLCDKYKEAYFVPLDEED